MEKPVAIRIFRPFATEADFLLAESPTITRTTVLLVGAQVRPTGVILRFEIVLQGGSALLRGEGRVVSHRKESTPTEPAGLLLKFTKLDPKSKALVDRINGVPGAPTSAPSLEAQVSKTVSDPRADVTAPPSLPAIASERTSFALASAPAVGLTVHPSVAPPLMPNAQGSVAPVAAVAIPPAAYEAPELLSHLETTQISPMDGMQIASGHQAASESERPTSIPPSDAQNATAPSYHVHNTYVSGMRAMSVGPTALASRPDAGDAIQPSVHPAPSSVSPPALALSSTPQAFTASQPLRADGPPASNAGVQAPPDRDALLKRLRERGNNLSKDTVDELLARAARD